MIGLLRLLAQTVAGVVAEHVARRVVDAAQRFIKKRNAEEAGKPAAPSSTPQHRGPVRDE